MEQTRLEDLVFKPSEEFVAQANIKKEMYDEANSDYIAWWAKQAAELVTFFKPYKKVLDDSNPPFYRWFTGGTFNVSYNCVDRHYNSDKRNKAALCYESEVGKKVIMTYRELYVEVNKFASALKKLGVKKGDRVNMYMPMIPEQAVAMLACARIGAIHSIVFGGFSADSLADRINDATAKWLITADGNWRKGAAFNLKANADAALEKTTTVEKVIVVKNTGQDGINMLEGRDVWYHDIMAGADKYCPCEEMEADAPLFLLYTSGSTGKPKGIQHSTAGYLTYTCSTLKYVFDLKETDVFWCTADIGWITGHSYVIYAPLALGMTTFMYDGTIDYPDKDRIWDMAERWGVTVFYTAPTAIRTYMKWGSSYPDKHDLSQLRILGTVGEPINPEAWMWYYKTIGKERCQIMDTWWQTETGGFMCTPTPVVPLKPGTATIPFPGVFVDVIDDNRQPTNRGYLVVKKPWPGMLMTIYGDNDRYKATYWGKFGDIYLAGDSAIKDEMGYIWVIGRIDDVLNVSGHRLGTAEIESALVECQEVAEAAVIGKKHDVKGEAPVAFVILKDGYSGSPELIDKLKKHVGVKIGPIARPDSILFTGALPKTRSGKIMRRLLKDIAEGRAIGDVTTLADPGAMQDIAGKYGKDED
ncbi:MAG: acetate--CoA ligase [Eubacteriales bacterium]